MASLNYTEREKDIPYNMRAICTINDVYKILEQAISENIKEYRLMYAFDNEIFTMGYEKTDKYLFMVWCPDGSIRTFDTLDEMKKRVTLGHNITILREFLTGNDESLMEASITDNFMLKSFLVYDNNKDYNLNIDDKINAQIQKLIERKPKVDDKTSNSTIMAIIIIVVILLIFVFFMLK